MNMKTESRCLDCAWPKHLIATYAEARKHAKETGHQVSYIRLLNAKQPDRRENNEVLDRYF